MTTEASPNIRSAVPFVCRFAQTSSSKEEPIGRDVLANEDPLPAVLGVAATGHVLARQTHRTFVDHETTDDT
jgi:hypothetical protein